MGCKEMDSTEQLSHIADSHYYCTAESEYCKAIIFYFFKHLIFFFFFKKRDLIP